MPEHSRTFTFFNGGWHEGNVPIMGARTHAAWLGSSVFDGARAFEGVTPDLDRHSERANRSATALGLAPFLSAGEIMEIAKDGLRHFDPGTAIYIKPMYWAEHDGVSTIIPDPASTRFCLCLFEAPMPEPKGFSLTLSRFRRPTPEQAPVDSKSGCLYPNAARALGEAKAAGFDNALVLDAFGYVAELATANIFLARNGEVHTPTPNGTFLNGITRQRVIKLLRDAGVTVHERSLLYRDFQEADEIFSTGNYAKVVPAIRIDNRNLQPGPFFQQARRLYWEFAHGG